MVLQEALGLGLQRCPKVGQKAWTFISSQQAVIASKCPIRGGQPWEKQFPVAAGNAGEGHSCETITVYCLSCLVMDTSPEEGIWV